MIVKKIKGITAVFCICAVFTAVAVHVTNSLTVQHASTQKVQYILDAGHGIPDGGAVGADGTTEQEINLAITKLIEDELNKKKIPSILTRNDENSIYTEGETIHAKKVSDVKRRIEIASQNPAVPFISIHMNTFSSPSVRGIQVFYDEANTESKVLAERLQKAFNAQIQQDNVKVCKPIEKNIYLFSHIKNPSVLIECGFMSNKYELEKLKTARYQQQLAHIIAEVLCS